MRFWMVAVIFTGHLFGAQWFHSFSEASKVAEKSNRYLLIMLVQEGCPTCEYMKEKVFPLPEVQGRFESSFVLLEVDSDERGDLPARFKARGTPTFYILKPDGKPAGRPIFGGMDSDNFLRLISERIGR